MVDWPILCSFLDRGNRPMFVASTFPVCSPSSKFDGLVSLPPDAIFLYLAMFVDPVRLSVTGPFRRCSLQIHSCEA